jgi:5-methylcytosine-specific restriction endonuclease McrA
VQPLTAEQSRLHVTVSREFLRKLEAAQDALSHALPDASPPEILEAGLELLLAQAEKRRGLVKKPQQKVRPAKGDHIPAHVRREVWKRDGGRCQYPLASGGICGATRHLELDHIHPESLGGPSTADNLRVVCRPHNDLAARLVLGDELMDRYGSGLRGAAREPRTERPFDGVAATSPA